MLLVTTEERGPLYHLAVATSARSLGIGRALVTNCFERQYYTAQLPPESVFPSGTVPITSCPFLSHASPPSAAGHQGLSEMRCAMHAPMEECFVFIGELVDDARLQMIVGLTPFKTT